MKSFNRAITFALALSLVAVVAPAQSIPQQTAVQPTPVARSVSAPAERSRALAQLSQQLAQSSPLRSELTGRLLIVPGPQSTPEDLSAVAEDVSIMARILEKGLQRAQLVVPAEFVGTEQLFANLLGHQRQRRPEALYLDGYGVLFFTSVGFPLAAPPSQTTKDEEPAEGGDPVWLRTREQMFSPPVDSTRRPTAEPYSAERVETLKRAVLESLKHATNIRKLNPQDRITVVVAEDREREQQAYAHSEYRLMVDRLQGTVMAEAQGEPGSSPAAMLIVRVRRTDVDDFAQGRVTVDQFREKAEIILSCVYPGAADGPAAWERPVPSLPRR